MPNKITYTAVASNTTKAIEYWNPFTQQYQDANPLTGIPSGSYSGLKARLKGSNPAIIATYAGSVTVTDGTTPTVLTVNFTIASATAAAGGSLSYSAAANGGTAPYQHLVQAENADTGAVTQIGTASTANYAGIWQTLPAGTYDLTDTVTDATGAVKISTVRRVVVGSAGTISIASFSPTTTQSGNPISITGTGFTGATSVTFNGIATSFITNSDTSITATVPTGAATGTITIKATAGTATSAATFTVVVASTKKVANIVCIGNSIVQGTNGFIPWPSVMGSKLPSTFTVTNSGLGGKDIQWIEDHVATALDANYDATAGVMNVCMFMEGTNSMSAGSNVAASDYVSRTHAYMLRARSRGWKIIMVTVPPQRAVLTDFNSRALAVNEQFLTGTESAFYDDVINLGLNNKTGRFAASTSADEPAWYYDGIHPTQLVQNIIGYMAYDSIQKVANGILPKPDPSNYPPEQVYPGTDTVWVDTTNAKVVGNSIYQDENGTGGQFGANGWSSQSFNVGDGSPGLKHWAEFTASERTGTFFGSCSSLGGAGSFGFFEAGWYFDNGSIKIWENRDLAPIAFAAGDRLRMEWYNDGIKYYRNGQLVASTNKVVAANSRVTVIADGGQILTLGGFQNCKEG